MSKIKKGISMVMAYLMIISLLPVGLFTIAAKAEENVPKYLNYNELYYTSVAQYKDETLVTYADTRKDPNYDLNYNYFKQLSLFKNGQETKVTEISYGGIYRLLKDTALITSYKDGDFNWNKYDFATGELSEYTLKETIPNEEKEDIVNKVNKKYNTNYYVGSAEFYVYEEFTTIYDKDGNKYTGITYIPSQESNVGYYVAYNKENSYIEENDNFSFYIDNENNLMTYSYVDQSVTKIKNNSIISKAKLNMNNSQWETFLTADKDYAYTLGFIDHLLIRYALKDGEYKFDKVMYENFYSACMSCETYGEVTGGDIWFLRKEGDRNFVFKIENGEAVKKYEVAPFMKYLKVYDENNLVVTSELGSTIINNSITKATISSEKDTTTVVVTEIIPNGINTINLTNEEKEVVINLNDIQAIKDGTGSVDVNLSNGTKINVPFSLIDKALLEGATNVKITCNTIDNSDIVKGLKAVNKVFDFSLLVEYGNTSKSIHQFANGEAEVTLALSDEELKGLDKTKIKVLYYNEETKKYEVMETTVDGNKVTFKTSHFSKFIVAEVNTSGQPVVISNNTTTTAAVTPKTGDTNSNVLVLGAFALVSLGIVITFSYKNLKKNKVK
jgi:LPXTG-motif cell wall-anchored protein